MKIIVIIGIFAFFLLCYLIWQYLELKKFCVTSYQIRSEKIEHEVRLAVLADLHGFVYGEENSRLIEKVRECRPHLILIAGDLIVSKYTDTYEKAACLLEQLVKIAPVYYSFGNHESRANLDGLTVTDEFRAYWKRIKELGVVLLNNENKKVTAEDEVCMIAGLEISLDYYVKREYVPMEKGYVEAMLGKAQENRFQILLAHNPMYSRAYADWGADLTFCGHNHGGLIRIPGFGSLLSPQFKWFPEYDAGAYEIEGKQVIVSRGLGTHTFHIRIFNRAELLNVQLLPQKQITFTADWIRQQRM